MSRSAVNLIVVARCLCQRLELFIDDAVNDLQVLMRLTTSLLPEVISVRKMLGVVFDQLVAQLAKKVGRLNLSRAMRFENHEVVVRPRQARAR